MSIRIPRAIMAIVAINAIVVLAATVPAQAVAPDNPGPGLTPKMAISATLTVAAPNGTAASQFHVGFNTPAAGDPLGAGPWATPKFVASQTQCTTCATSVTLDIIRGGVTTSYPLEWVSNFQDKSYLLKLQGNRTLGFVGALVGDVVRINFAEGAFLLPDPSTGLVPFIRFDSIKPSDGANGPIVGASSTSTFGAPPSVTPGAPSAIAGDGQATVSIAAGASAEGVTGYRLTASPGGKYCDVTLPATSCVVTGLENGSAYTFTSVATNASGSSTTSSASAAVTPSAKLAVTGTGGGPLALASMFAILGGVLALAAQRIQPVKPKR